MRKPTHGDKGGEKSVKGLCMLARSTCSESEAKNYKTSTYGTCLPTKYVEDHLEDCRKVTNNVRSILSKLNISVNYYDYVLTELTETLYQLGKSLRWNRRKVSTLVDELSNCRLGVEEQKTHKYIGLRM